MLLAMVSMSVLSEEMMLRLNMPCLARTSVAERSSVTPSLWAFLRRW